MDKIWIAEMAAGEFDEYICVSDDPLEAVAGVFKRHYETEKHRAGILHEKIRWGHHNGRPLTTADIDLQEITLGKGYLSSEDEDHGDTSDSFCNEIIEKALKDRSQD
jgi:hypothetical protein